ncbi:vWA domain-containing protein [Dolichospermum circinale]|uniref:vWA domain-containing protein n=1 Tax=Dolichospermum circinale TaxID=109265 RepID=UPI001E315DA7|nr:vWA domain-containing protein [Dolichospermum circinale]MDB9474980.1 VWA domain-containing protein [Dolichospermum circinale CS-537/11]MDB9477372.1 VWA domain-containing protein [Dolichospermum circinale CS-537/03]MDB9481113.1 VWA domain-containing protein [Dolichospermum circinale CS-537/05]
MRKNIIALSTTTAFWTPRLSLSLLLLLTMVCPSLAQVKKAEIIGSPTFKDDRVTIRIKVKGGDDRPVMGLEDSNFKLTVDKKEVQVKPKDWKSPEETVPPPAWIVVLLDFSGSMNQVDSGGTKKIAGAINAIREFTKISAERGGNTQISIVPFGKTGSNCPESPVNKETLDKFLAANDFKLQNNLDYLKSLTPCASTDLYEPLTKAVKFLGNSEDSRFSLPENSSQPQPRLSIILLSDGYHNVPNEGADFAALTKLLKKHENITVHTLGYGLTPEQLGVKYKLGRPATRADLKKGKVPEAEFVDQKRLGEIAKLTGGIAEFSGNAERIAENLQLFLNALLGEYEITFTQPDAERGSKHQVQVKVSSQKGKAKESQIIEYIMPVFGRSLPLGVRLIMVISVLLIVIIGGVVPFHYWGKYLKAEAQRD